MAFTLEEVVPWGRSFDEYVAMFALSGRELERPVLGCGDGPASFNAELTDRGGHVVSIDPVYRFSAAELERRVEQTCSTVLEQTRKNRSQFVWKVIESPEQLGRVRMEAMGRFLADYPQGKRQGRYLPGELPGLPFSDRAFGLALCSHFLFLYSEHFSLDFHLRAIAELCRVAGEARIFPLIELGGARSRHLEAVLNGLAASGYECRIKRVEYEFQRGGNEMLRVVRGS